MKRNLDKNIPVVFIVGSPRSGTTILGEVLGRHPDIINWYEPYFIWDWHLGNLETDVRTHDMLTEEMRRFIRDEFSIFLRKSGKKFIVEKTPENSYKISFLNAVFPNAKWIHIIRDGRDVTLSINREWTKRQQIVEKRRYAEFYAVVKEMFSLQPFWRNRLQAVLFEMKNSSSLMPHKIINKSKWKGNIGWGPRFPGWQEAFRNHSLLRFNALQWLRSVETVLRDSLLISERNWMEIRFEQLITDPKKHLSRVFDFLDVTEPLQTEIWNDLNPSIIGKWKKSFSRQELLEIEEIIGPELMRMGY